MDLKCELILIGNELLNGHKKDANLHQLTRYLSSKGLSLTYVQIMGDDIHTLQQAFLLASSRSQIIITSGGLGPTKDDLTKEALAKTFHLPMTSSQQAIDITQQHYQRAGRTCHFETNHYDLLPAGCEALHNPVGFAPGIYFHHVDKNFSFLLAPGVPKEFSGIIELHGEKILSSFSHYIATTQLCWKTYGIPEEKIFSELSPNLWNDLSCFGTVASLPHLSGVDITLTLEKNKILQYQPEIDRLIDRSGLLPYIWTREKISVPEHLVQLAKKKNVSFGFVESCTGGLASHLVTQVQGCSKVFAGSLVTYQTQVKNSLLHIDSSITQDDGVNEETALLMSRHGQQMLNTDFCLSLTGFAGPTGGNGKNPVGRLWLAISGRQQQQIKKLDFIGNRQDRIERFSYAGLHFLRQEIEKLVE